MIINNKPLTCEMACELMFDYIDGTLNEPQSLQLEEHIECCEACRKELAQRREMLELIKLSADPVPDALFTGVMDKIADVPREKKNPIPRFRFLWGAATVAACVVLTVLVVGKGNIFGRNDLMSGDVTNADLAGVTDYGAAEAAAEAVAVPTEAFDEGSIASDVLFDAADVEAEEYEVYTATTAALTASAPLLYSNYSEFAEPQAQNERAVLTAKAMSKEAASAAGGASSEWAAFDSLYDTLDITDNAVIICESGEIDALLDGDGELLRSGENQFLAYTLTEEVSERFSDYIEQLEESGVPYRACMPTDSVPSTLCIYVLAHTEE